MCRMFAVHASGVTCATGSLLSAPRSLVTQSCSDAEEGLCHQDGWGLGLFVDGQPNRIRSTLAAQGDEHYQHFAQTFAAPTLLAHVRRASAGSVALRNTHPFLFGSWLFAHNGTLQGFPEKREQLLNAIPNHLREKIEGDTDSELAFRFVLARLEKTCGSLTSVTDAPLAASAMAEAIRQLVKMFPDAAEPSQFNFLLTNGRIVLASRWGHSLSWLERRGPDCPIADQPAAKRPDYRAVVIASEPTSTEPWKDLPDRSLLAVNSDLTASIIPITG